MKSQSRNWAIVGGGMLGMTLAYRLARQGEKVTLIESANHLGGLADAWTIGDVAWDRFYHVTLLSDLKLRGLLKDLDLESELEWVETKTGFYTDGEFYSMSNTIEFLKFPPLGMVSKLRLGGTIFLASRLRNWRRLEQIPVAEWLRRWSGAKTFEKIWLPLLRAKLGENYKVASAAFIWTTIARMYAARRTGLKKEMFGYVKGGYRRVLAEFECRLRELGVEIHLSMPTTCVQRVGDVVRVNSHDVTLGDFDQVILTTPSYLSAQLVPDLTAAEKERLNGVKYQGVICASLLIKNALGPYYVTNVTDGFVPFTGVIEMTALVDPEHLHGNHLVYLPKYVSADDDQAFAKTDEEIRQSFLSALKQMYSHFDESEVLAFKIARVRRVMAIPTLNFSQRVPKHRTSVQGISIVNSSQIVNGTLNVNETIGLADQGLQEILNDSATMNFNSKNQENGDQPETARELVARSR